MRVPVERVSAVGVVLARDDVDTDAIYPARFLKTVERRGLGRHLFADWRDGDPSLDWAQHASQQGELILLSGRNFGCGSSREHAVWSLADKGVRAVLALSFGDIFRANCVRNGVIAATLLPEDESAVRAAVDAGQCLTIDVLHSTASATDGRTWRIGLRSGDAALLLSAQDDIGRTLAYEVAIKAYERRIEAEEPWRQRA